MYSQETHMKKTYIRECRMKKYTPRVQNSKAKPATLLYSTLWLFAPIKKYKTFE